MPELPEVETVLRTLEYQLGEAGIEEVQVFYPKMIEGDPSDFIKRLKGQHFRRYLRRGKYLLFEMDDLTLEAHLRMEGKFFIQSQGTPKAKHDHVIFTLSDGRQLHYNDVRKFGRMMLIPKRKSYARFRDLGPEPLSSAYNSQYVKEYFAATPRKVKEVLLDQHFCAGIGNIYADEMLYGARIHPCTPCNRLSEKEIRSLVRQGKKILREAIAAGGTTVRSYTSSLGVTGLFQNELRAYGRKDLSCRRCGKKIVRTVVGGRGTHYCPHCQKEKI
ncbi:MAG: DNA-formamidopyrimidine glycosylase [Erysipelotrichaceae bacterium]|nr:DNA-formamidopyrimidine glycosylase [Erysipelotrichaceae bacterium]